MSVMGTEKIQLGQTGWLLGDLSNLISGALEVEIYVCKKCGKIEFYQSRSDETTDSIAQVKCPQCGKSYDMDYPKCPYCKYKCVT
jgi:DNA-directed RNA polymerase subunit RPC12/RpoP